jgi:hypothetical protein
MKRAASISLGSSARDKRVELDLLGERVVLERIGTNVLEAALVAIAGQARPLTRHEPEVWIGRLELRPTIEHLNG